LPSLLQEAAAIAAATAAEKTVAVCLLFVCGMQQLPGHLLPLLAVIMVAGGKLKSFSCV